MSPPQSQWPPLAVCKDSKTKRLVETKVCKMLILKGRKAHGWRRQRGAVRGCKLIRRADSAASRGTPLRRMVKSAEVCDSKWFVLAPGTKRVRKLLILKMLLVGQRQEQAQP
jgi:hypothetical protein